jgi:hypothetical protein
MAICKKCDGQGVVSKLTQLDGSEEGLMGGLMFAALTCGVSLLATTRTKEVRCPRCNGYGRVGA